MQIKSWFFIFLMTILALTGIYSQSSLSYYEGDVTVLRNSREMEADFGMDLLTGDLIRSGRNSVAIIEMEHGRTLKLREDSSLVLENLSRQTSVALKKGSVFSRVERLSGGSFNVHTDAVVAGVRGTEFFMAFGETIDHEPDLWLCVNEGTVEVSLKKGDESVLVEEGEG
ncbi:MAG: FecR family protein [Spirochaetales bacterium]|nr:FecR family protein [Spirochaetales bacterium]